MKKKLNGVVMLICLSALGLTMAACDNSTTGGGGASNKWSELAGNWEWTEGQYGIRLEIDNEIYFGDGYGFQVYYDLSTSTGWGNVFLCSYDGTTLRKYDYPNTTEQTFTVVKSSNGPTLTFSNYHDFTGKGSLSYLNGKTFTRVYD